MALPRGGFDAAIDLLTPVGIRPELRDERFSGTPIGARFLGTLTKEQQTAADALIAPETGVLAATTAFGKTVIAAKLIAERNTNTLVLVCKETSCHQAVFTPCYHQETCVPCRTAEPGWGKVDGGVGGAPPPRPAWRQANPLSPTLQHIRNKVPH